MLKITEKEVKELLKDARNEHPFGWQLYRVGVFIYEGKINTFISYHGQGLNEIIYNETYDDIVEFDDLCTNEYTLQDATDIAYDMIRDMIESYEE